MLKTYKYRLFPTKRQQTLFRKTLDECRWLYNYFLEERRNSWEKSRKSLTYFDQTKSLPELKRERPSLKSVYAQVLQNVAVRVDLAFKGFFRRVKRGEKPGYPRFKGENRYDSFTFPQMGFEITEQGLRFSKIGVVKIKLHRPIEGKIKTLTVRRKRDKWYACFSCEVESKPLEKFKEAVGIDVGLRSFATLSNGEKIENPRFFKTDQKALAKAQRKLSKCEKGTPERKKARKVVARIYERIANRRDNFCHQVSRKLVNRFGIICVEDLSINKMKENSFRSLNRSINDAAWGQFIEYLLYKAVEAGGQVVKVNPAYTTQDCSQCGYRQFKKLSEQIFHCPACGFEADRDYNASLNILRLGIQSLGNQSIEAPANQKLAGEYPQRCENRGRGIEEDI